MIEDAALDVPTEVFEDHVILRPPNRLKSRVAARSEPKARHADPVRRAEQALRLLENEFEGWMEGEIDALETARTELARRGSGEDVARLYRAAHDIRGQAATFGFPLVGEVADGLCRLMEALGDAAPPQALVDRHVEAVRAMVRERVRDREHPLGAALARRLAELRRQTAPRAVENV